MKDLHALAREARAAAWELAACPLEKRNAARSSRQTRRISGAPRRKGWPRPW